MNCAKTVLFRLLEWFFSRRAKTSELPPVPKILVLQLQQIGDSVLFTPALRALRSRFPDAEIDLLASPVAAQFHKKSPYVNRIHVARSWSTRPRGTRVRPMLPVLAAMRREGYDCVIADVTQQSFKYSLLALLTGARVRVGFNRNHRGFLHSVQVPFRGEADWVQLNLDLVGALGARTDDRREEVAFDRDDVAAIEALLSRAHQRAAARSPIVALHIGSNWQSRTWYADRWAAIGDALETSHGATIVFVGAPGEREAVEEVRALMRRPSTTLVGATDIPELAALMSVAQLFVGTDSGPRHVAGAAGTPHVVVMCDQDDTDRWLGFRPGEIVIRSDARCGGCYFARCAHKLCMENIEVSRVLADCERHLNACEATRATAWLDQVPVPPERYMAHAGRPDADCKLLRRLAHSKSASPSRWPS